MAGAGRVTARPQPLGGGAHDRRSGVACASVRTNPLKVRRGPPFILGMNEDEAIEALSEIGLRGHARSTGHWEWRHVFVIGPDGGSQGRLSFRNGRLESVKWYCPTSGRMLPDERWAWAWLLWTQRRERLSLARWNVEVQNAILAAEAERDEKQAWRDANPGPKRKPLQLRIRKHLANALLGSSAGPAAQAD